MNKNIAAVNNKMKPFSDMTRQGGWTFWSLGFTLLVFGFFAYVFMQLVPVYATNANIEKAMQGSVEGVDIRKVRRNDISFAISKQLALDGTQAAVDLRKGLVVKRTRDMLTIDVAYEPTIHLFFNISILATFNPRLECDFSGQCEKSSGLNQ